MATTDLRSLVDLHFEVRNAIAEVLSAPTAAGRVALQRSIHRFLAAERALGALGQGVAGRAQLEQHRAELLDGLRQLDAAADRAALFGAAESLRRTFLHLCEPLWHLGRRPLRRSA